ncbi:MAG: hydrogenase iron-sulfur subunit [Candidatus Heimdallarchaeota archaeon]
MMNSSALFEGHIGVFLCTCKGSITKVVDLDKVAEFIREGKLCESFEIHDCLCEDSGLSAIRRAIKRDELECVIVGGCSPKLNEQLFREEVERAGINPLLLEVVNLREQCAWVHANYPSLATEKAKLLVAGSLEKARFFWGAKSLPPKDMRFKQPIARRDLLRSLFRLFKEYRSTATINAQMCAGARGGCEYCVESCPFQAVYQGEALAVREDLCRACGICSAVCPLGAIQLPTFTDEQLVAQLRGILANGGVKLSPRIVVFSCDEHSYLAADAAGTNGLSYPPNVLIVRVPCIGSISEVHILKAFELGATGILLSGCSSGSCPYIKGNDLANRTCDFTRKLLSAFRLPPECIDVVENSRWGAQDFVDSVEGFLKRVSLIAHHLSQIRGDTLPGLTRRESLLNLIKSFSEKLRVVPTLHEYGTLHPPFAEVKIDAEKCTMCGICVNRCLTKAMKLLKKENATQINFTHAWCIDCGICENTCPEEAIEMNRVIDLRQLVERSEQTLVEQKFVSCIKCGKPFIPNMALKLISKAIQEKSTATEEQLNFMKTCYECRTKALLAG